MSNNIPAWTWPNESEQTEKVLRKLPNREDKTHNPNDTAETSVDSPVKHIQAPRHFKTGGWPSLDEL